MDIFDKNGKISSRKIVSNKLFCDSLLQKWSTDSIPEAIHLENGNKRIICPECGNYCKFRSGKYSKFCCISCSTKFNSKKGNEHHLSNPEIIKKREKTLQEKFGISNVQQIEKVQQKTKETNKNRFGVESILSDRNKIAQALQEKYGVINNSQRAEVKEKVKNTLLQRYGGHNWANPEIRRKCQLTYVRKKLEKLNVLPLFNLDEDYKNNRDNHKWKCTICSTEFISTIFSNVRCPTCFPRLCGTSQLEQEILQFIQQNYIGEIITNDRKLISPLELDIVIPDLKIAIEINGLYWHSELNGCHNHYHLWKTEAVETQGHQLLHIFEDEWLYKQEIVKSKLLSFLNKHQKVYARHCEIREISTQFKNEFLNNYHLQGADKSLIKLGLFYKNECLSVCTFGKPRFNKQFDWECIRAASKSNISVIGGFSKLLNYFRKNYSGTIISYADRRWSNGNLYKSLGFECIGVSKPAYWYMKGYKQRLHRTMFQKHLLSSNDGTEWEIMQREGYDRIWDCGTTKWALYRI